MNSKSLDTKQEISKFEKENRWRRIFVPVYKNAKRSREDLVESRRICSDSFPSRVGNRVLSSEERGKFWNWGKKRRGRETGGGGQSFRYRRWMFSFERKLLRIWWNVKADRLESANSRLEIYLEGIENETGRLESCMKLDFQRAWKWIP